MKLLGWMRTISRSTFDPSKELKGSFCCLRAQVSSEVKDIRTNSFSFSRQSHHDPTPLKTDEELWLDEGGFSGFLTIGTFGRDPETPKFTASALEDDVTGAKKDMAKLVTEKLDKFLEEYPEDSSSKQVVISKAEPDACPAQGHGLFPSSTELAKRSNKVKKTKGLLKSLFKGRKEVERECNSMEKHGKRDFIKRIFKKVHSSPSKTRNDDDDDEDSMHTKKDIRKSVQIFQRKVHPVICTPERDGNEIDDRRSCNLNGGFLVPISILKVNKKTENWIKTDTEYHVLEL
ncbi:Uncharacterized protein HA466_0310830 [Hirschfeldia incana]|nr:Uncharacterized protein HA466_0310830 [Hirschfeldia incana]